MQIKLAPAVRMLNQKYLNSFFEEREVKILTLLTNV